MSGWVPLRINEGGLNVKGPNAQYVLACSDASNGLVLAVEFFNAGTNSIVVIAYGGIVRRLAAGASWTASAPSPCFPHLPVLTTDYHVNFVSGGGAAAQVNNCLIVTQRYQL